MTALFRWQKRPEPREHQMRVIRKILIFPKCLGREWRWLGREEIRQTYHAWGWMDRQWADEYWVE